MELGTKDDSAGEGQLKFTQPNKESMLTTEELLEAVFSLLSDPKLFKEDSSVLRTMVSSQSQ
jgi:hypothetical protein